MFFPKHSHLNVARGWLTVCDGSLFPISLHLSRSKAPYFPGLGIIYQRPFIFPTTGTQMCCKIPVHKAPNSPHLQPPPPLREDNDKCITISKKKINMANDYMNVQINWMIKNISVLLYNQTLIKSLMITTWQLKGRDSQLSACAWIKILIFVLLINSIG